MDFSISQIPYDPIALAKRDRAFLDSDKSLFSLLPFPDNMDGLRKKIADRNRYPFFRKELHLALQEQYATLPDREKTEPQILAILQENTFTVTTAHQPSLFTGPLYLIYKAASCIHLARRMQQALPEKHFVPVFVLGAEDHDFDEINHLHIYNQTISWQQKSGGPTGKMPTKGLDTLIDRIEELLPHSLPAEDIIRALRQAFTTNLSFADATQRFIHHLFGRYGMLVLQMDSPRLKRLAIPIFRKEIIERPSFDLVNQSLAKLKKWGFKPQAKPRKLNLFYMTADWRKRIVLEDGVFHVLDTGIRWTQPEILQKLEQSPQSFSPNVILRPLYQELILPNIAYIGGGGELAYWQERPLQFQEFDISFPVLIRRNSVLWLSPYIQKLMSKARLTTGDLFEQAKNLVVAQDEQIDLSTERELADLDAIFDSLAQKAEKIDPALIPSLLAEKAKQRKAIKQIESKLSKAHQQKNQSQIRKIQKIQSIINPNNGLQERYENFLPIYAIHGHDFLDFLVQQLNPLQKTFLVISSNPSQTLDKPHS